MGNHQKTQNTGNGRRRFLLMKGMVRFGALVSLLIGIVAWTPQQASAIDLEDLGTAERAALEQLIFDYIMSNPEVILESVQTYQEALASGDPLADREAIARVQETLMQSPAAWSGGNQDGDVTIVEFLDYRCGFCRQMFEIVNRVVETDGDIRFVIKEFPILGEQSNFMARLALAIRNLAGDEVYKTVHDALMGESEINEAFIEELAETYDIAVTAITEELMSDAVTASIAESYDLAEELRISGTPAFVIGDRILRGAVTEEEMIATIAEVRAMKEHESGSGGVN